MKNFEEALERIDALEKENHNLQVKLKKALWTEKSSSVEDTDTFTNIQVGDNDEVDKERQEAMERFTERMRNDSKKYREERNGKITK